MIKTKILKEKGYNIHVIKTNKYKTSKIAIDFNLPVTKENYIIYYFLASMMNEGSFLYKTRRSKAIKEEELYNARYFISYNLMGDALVFNMSIFFINEEYIKEENYINDIIDYFLSFVLNPNVKDNKFSLSMFRLVKKQILDYINSINENALYLANEKAFSYLDSFYTIYGKEKEIKKVTPSILYDYYVSLLKDSLINVYIMGNTDVDNIANIFKNKFKINNNCKDNLNYYIKVKDKKKLVIKEEISVFKQSHLVYLFNIDNLTEKERNVTTVVFNYLLGSGGLNSKLYSILREKKKYCYRVSSNILKYSNILSISISYAKENTNKIIKEIDNIIEDLACGNFDNQDLVYAINNLYETLENEKEKDHIVLSYYIRKYLTKSYGINEVSKTLKLITKEDIMVLAKKIKSNLIFILSEANDENN